MDALYYTGKPASTDTRTVHGTGLICRCLRTVRLVSKQRQAYNETGLYAGAGVQCMRLVSMQGLAYSETGLYVGAGVQCMRLVSMHW